MTKSTYTQPPADDTRNATLSVVTVKNTRAEPRHTGGSRSNLLIDHVNVRFLPPSVDDFIDMLENRYLDIVCISESCLGEDNGDNYLAYFSWL